MEQTAESAGDSADELEGFSERFQGAMSAAVAALAVGAAGLLSQVPVLGGLFSGLAAVVEAVAFQMDGVLRPALGPLTQGFFKLSQMIFEADGIIGDIIGAIGTIVSIVAIAAAAAFQFGSGLATLSAAAGTAASVLGTIVGVITTVGAAILSLPGLIVAAIAAIAAFAVAYLTNFRGIRDKTNALVGEIVSFVVSGFNALASDAVQAVSGLASDVVSFFTGIASDINAWADGLISDAFEWGRSLIQRFLGGIRTALSTVRDFLGDLRDIGANVGIDVPDLGSLGGGGGGGGTGRPAFRGSGGDTSVRLDGRDVSDRTGRYRADGPRRRGL